VHAGSKALLQQYPAVHKWLMTWVMVIND